MTEGEEGETGEVTVRKSRMEPTETGLALSRYLRKKRAEAEKVLPTWPESTALLMAWRRERMAVWSCWSGASREVAWMSVFWCLTRQRTG